jgi:CRP-like cAMP-binding protein
MTTYSAPPVDGSLVNRSGDGSTARTTGRANLLLAALSPESRARLEPHLEPVHLASGQTLWEPDARIRSVYFPEGCVASLLVPLVDEAPVEAATVGWESMVGIPIVLGAESTSTHAIAQVPGSAFRLPSAILREALREDRSLLDLLLRAAQALQEQTAQSVACNARHSVDERCARWLLLTHDRVGGDEFLLTQEFLARMLGVRRASVTVAAGMLQQAGLIRYGRGHITVLDRDRLELASCECYGIVKAKYDRLLGR